MLKLQICIKDKNAIKNIQTVAFSLIVRAISSRQPISKLEGVQIFTKWNDIAFKN